MNHHRLAHFFEAGTLTQIVCVDCKRQEAAYEAARQVIETARWLVSTSQPDKIHNLKPEDYARPEVLHCH